MIGISIDLLHRWLIKRPVIEADSFDLMELHRFFFYPSLKRSHKNHSSPHTLKNVIQRI